MTTTPTQRPGAASALARGAAAVEARRRCEVEVLEAALEFARAHRVTTDSRAASWSEDPDSLFGAQPIRLAGAGAPRVAEFAPMEWAAVTGVSHEAALSLLGDVLDLSVRLPRTWALVRDLRIPVFLGRLAAQESRDLDQAAAAHADRLLAWKPRTLNPHRIGVLVHEARLYADPDRAAADHDHALARREVRVDHSQGAPGTSWVAMTLDTGDAEAFDHTIGRMAGVMGSLGHPGSLDARRAHSVGVLADPQAALDLLAGDPADANRSTDPEHDPAVCVADEVAYRQSNPFALPQTSDDGRLSGRDATIVFHITDRDLLAAGESGITGKGGVARSPKLGPVLMSQLTGWLMLAGEVTVKPVLDIETIAPVDAHDPPDRMAEAVRLRDEHCVFPGCRVTAARCDLDHITPYVPLDEGGPPGQTNPANLAPLCRKHHRAKTFGEFDYHRRPDGSYEWDLPAGAVVTTDPHTPRPFFVGFEARR